MGPVKKAAKIVLWVLAALFALAGIFALADGDIGGGIVLLVLALAAFEGGRRVDRSRVAKAVAVAPPPPPPPPPPPEAVAQEPPAPAPDAHSAAPAPAPSAPAPTRPLWSRRPVQVGAVILGLVVLGAALSGGGDDDDSAQPAATTAEVATPATTEAATTAAATTEAEPVDTGRMSQGEFDTFSGRLDAIDAEVFEYGQGLQKCSVLLQALELAEASDCIGEAYEGVGDDMLLAYSSAEGLEGDVAKRCLTSLRAYKQRLDVFYGWHERTQDAGENLQFDEFNRLAGQSGAQGRAYSRARARVLRDCAPA
jgi:hypothetical protein